MFKDTSASLEVISRWPGVKSSFQSVSEATVCITSPYMPKWEQYLWAKNTFLSQLLDLHLAQVKVSPLIPISQGDLWFKF